MLEWKILEKGESTAKVVKKGLLRLTELEGAYLYSRNRTALEAGAAYTESLR